MFLPISFKLKGKVMDLRLSQPLKAESPILSTPEGNVTDVRLLHPEYLLLVDYQYYTF